MATMGGVNLQVWFLRQCGLKNVGNLMAAVHAVRFDADSLDGLLDPLVTLGHRNIKPMSFVFIRRW